jgi:hypothetical protein
MSEDQQIRNIIATAKSAPKQIGVFIDDYKEERFKKKLRAGLPDDDFEILITGGITPKTKTIIIKRKISTDVSNN